jgi:predicted small lipoprotein YifL
MRILLPTALLAAVLAGCGFKGPLYLPLDKPKAVKPAAPSPDLLVTPDPQRPAPPEATPPPK